MQADRRTLIVLVFILQENMLKINRRKVNLRGIDKGLASIDRIIKGICVYSAFT
jgi:hypothetical protein